MDSTIYRTIKERECFSCINLPKSGRASVSAPHEVNRLIQSTQDKGGTSTRTLCRRFGIGHRTVGRLLTNIISQLLCYSIVRDLIFNALKIGHVCRVVLLFKYFCMYIYVTTLVCRTNAALLNNSDILIKGGTFFSIDNHII